MITKPDTATATASHAARTTVALLVQRNKIIGPIVAGVRSPKLGRKLAQWTAVDRDYEVLRIDTQILFDDLAVITEAAQRYVEKTRQTPRLLSDNTSPP